MTVKRTLALLAILALIPLVALAKGTKPTPWFESGGIRQIGYYPYAIDVLDVEADGDLDIVSTLHDRNYLGLPMNDGVGGFSGLNYIYPAPLLAHGICSADFDGDGDVDVAAAIDDPDNTWNLAVFISNGDRYFEHYVLYETAARSTNVIAADLDGDDDMDLAVTSQGNQSVSVLMNYGDGTFAPAVHYPATGCNLTDLFAVDMDGDLDPDLIAVGDWDDYVFVFMSNGDGTFADAVTYPHGGRYAHSVTAADFDGDGDYDVATANDHSWNVSILKNKGDGTLMSPTILEGGPNPVAITAADLDNDGDPDLAVSNIGESGSPGKQDYTISVWENKNGVFRSDTKFVSGDGPAGIVAADLDGDLDLDLAVAVAYDIGVEVFFNSTRTSCCMIRGDVDNSGQLDILDLDYLSEYLYSAGPESPCMDEADVDGNGVVEEADLDYLVAYLWAGGPAPVSCPDQDGDGIIDLCQDGGGGGKGTRTDSNAYPNPFNPQTTIAFELPQVEAVRLRVFDVSGRLVRELIGGETYDQGRHEAIWRGADDAGRQMSSGTYFYRLEAGEFSETKRMVLVK
ncbi:MAG: VCBS repeat-containing protein [Gemmatimonadales bacterium]|nr:VCBS repeat-containing protein [Gemmatimonadales bacterium]